MTTNEAFRKLFASAVCIACAFALLASPASAQKRDYLTEAEIELVRDAQQIDLRVLVLVTAVERRLAAIEGSKSPIKDESKWGPAPKGSRLELLRDIEGLVRKAIDDLDDVASRNGDSEFFPKAVRKMATSCQGFGPRLKVLLDTTRDEKERGTISRSLENCGAVVEAVEKLPKETNPKSGKKP